MYTLVLRFVSFCPNSNSTKVSNYIRFNLQYTLCFYELRVLFAIWISMVFFPFRFQYYTFCCCWMHSLILDTRDEITSCPSFRFGLHFIKTKNKTSGLLFNLLMFVCFFLIDSSVFSLFLYDVHGQEEERKRRRRSKIDLENFTRNTNTK